MKSVERNALLANPGSPERNIEAIGGRVMEFDAIFLVTDARPRSAMLLMYRPVGV